MGILSFIGINLVCIIIVVGLLKKYSGICFFYMGEKEFENIFHVISNTQFMGYFTY